MNDDLISRIDAGIYARQRSRDLLLDSLADGDAAAQERAFIGTSSAIPLRDAFTIADCERMANGQNPEGYRPPIIEPDDDPYASNSPQDTEPCEDRSSVRPESEANWPMNWDTIAERNGDR